MPEINKILRNGDKSDEGSVCSVFPFFLSASVLKKKTEE